MGLYDEAYPWESGEQYEASLDAYPDDDTPSPDEYTLYEECEVCAGSGTNEVGDECNWCDGVGAVPHDCGGDTWQD